VTKKEVDAYIADPLADYRERCVARSMFAAGAARGRFAGPRAHRKDLPIYIFAGDKDPITRSYRAFWPWSSVMKAAGIKDMKRLLSRRPHEMLNEDQAATKSWPIFGTGSSASITT